MPEIQRKHDTFMIFSVFQWAVPNFINYHRFFTLFLQIFTLPKYLQVLEAILHYFHFILLTFNLFLTIFYNFSTFIDRSRYVKNKCKIPIPVMSQKSKISEKPIETVIVDLHYLFHRIIQHYKINFLNFI